MRGFLVGTLIHCSYQLRRMERITTIELKELYKLDKENKDSPSIYSSVLQSIKMILGPGIIYLLKIF